MEKKNPEEREWNELEAKPQCNSRFTWIHICKTTGGALDLKTEEKTVIGQNFESEVNHFLECTKTRIYQNQMFFLKSARGEHASLFDLCKHHGVIVF